LDNKNPYLNRGENDIKGVHAEGCKQGKMQEART
jgi:hypothetical protein